MSRLLEGAPKRAVMLIFALLIALAVAPLFANDYLLTILIVILYFAYVGQAWNIMMGFAGQLSLGHAIYVGLGAYASAALYVHFGIGPWIGVLIAIPVAMGGASTGILYPGDRVDVILTQTFKNDPPLTRRSVGETVVQNLRVLAIDPVDSRSNGAANGFGRTVTLEVTPDQAERVNVATELGKLSLTLRSAERQEERKPVMP